MIDRRMSAVEDKLEVAPLAGTEVTQLSRRRPLLAPGGYFNRSAGRWLSGT